MLYLPISGVDSAVVGFFCQQHTKKPSTYAFFLPFTLSPPPLTASIIDWLDIVSLCWSPVMIGQSFPHVLFTIRLPGDCFQSQGPGHGSVKPWGDVFPHHHHNYHPLSGFMELGCDRGNRSLSTSQCTVRVAWMAACEHSFTDVEPVATCWQRCCELDIRAQESQWHPAVTSAYSPYATVYSTWQQGKALNQSGWD